MQSGFNLVKKKQQQKLLRKINFFSLKQKMYFEFIWMISYQLSLFSFFRFPDLTYSTKLPLSELPLSKDKYWSIVAYNQSKLCNLLFSMELNRRLKPKGGHVMLYILGTWFTLHCLIPRGSIGSSLSWPDHLQRHQ